MTRRLRRLYETTLETYRRTGNPFKAIWFCICYVIVKSPMLMQQVGAQRRSRAVARDVRAARPARLGGTPLVAVKITGGLGDRLVIARFLRDLAAACGPVNFDIFSLHPEQARWIFSGLEELRACHQEAVFDHVQSEYDAALRVNQFVVLEERSTSWTSLARYPELLQAMKAVQHFRSKIEVFVENYPHMDNFLAQKAVFANRTRADFLHLMAGLPYGGDEQPLCIDMEAPFRYGLTPGSYVTINNGFDQDFVISGKRATKCYPHFDAVVRLLRAGWPGLRFVQVGSRTSEPLASIDVDLVGRTSLPEAAAIIASSVLHIDNEGGLVHLARSLGVVSVVVFGPTPAAYFGYQANINIEPPFCGGCWWINQTWMDHCPRGFAEARCMSEQPPELVAARATAYLQANDLVARHQLATRRSEEGSVGGYSDGRS